MVDRAVPCSMLSVSAKPSLLNIARRSGRSTLKRLDRLRLGDFRTAIPAGAPRVVVPEIEHGLAEVIDDIGAIEIDVFDERAALVAVENNVLVLASRAAALDDDADGIGRSNRGVRHIRRNEEGLTLADEMIDDAVALADADFDVALELVEIFFRIHEVKIVPRIRPFDHHDEKIAPIVEVAVADRRFEELAVGFDPIIQIHRRLDLGGAAGFRC
jgi:hypothetical protein